MATVDITCSSSQRGITSLARETLAGGITVIRGAETVENNPLLITGTGLRVASLWRWLTFNLIDRLFRAG
jgi:hypothetical protein